MALYVIRYALAALLPIIGFGRLLYRAQRALDAVRAKVAERGHDELTFGDWDEDNASILREPTRARNAVIWDIALVGAGLIIGAITSIAALPW